MCHRFCTRNMVRIVRNVEGLPKRVNDIIYCPPLELDDGTDSTVVFFPGDVQNYPELMECDPENKLYVKWNLMNVACMLQSHYKLYHVVVVKPSRMESNIYSCYDSFLRCDKFGVPLDVSYDCAVPHLEALLMNTSTHLLEEQTVDVSSLLDNASSDLIDRYRWRPNESCISLIGFSKGCVVINQIIYELCRDLGSRFLKKNINSVSWLDGGHGGSSKAWITEPNVLHTLASFPWKINVEVTPYQVGRRDWVKNEENLFSTTLHSFGANIERRLHFASSPPSLLNHFRLLDILYS